MNYLTLFMLLIVLCFSQSIAQNSGTIIPGFPCPLEDIVGGCRGAKECLYPNLNNCNAFIRCNGAGIAFNTPCSPGFQWNDNKKKCDWPWHSTCSRPTTLPPTTTTTTPGPFVCPVEDIANTGCMGPKDCLYPNPTNCNQFIQCMVNADGVTGTPIVRDCPAGLEWNDAKKQCDWPAEANCSTSSYRKLIPPFQRFYSYGRKY